MALQTNAARADAGPVLDQDPDVQRFNALDKLFDLWDVDSSGQLEFEEVSGRLRQLAPAQDAASTRNAAVEALLLADQNGNGKLSKDEFRQLMKRIASAAQLPSTAVMERLLGQAQPSAEQPLASDRPPHKRLQNAAVSTSAPTSAQPAEQQQADVPSSSQPADASGPHAKQQQRRQQQQQQQDVRPKVVALFELFDRNGDGTVSFCELCQGLEKFMPQGSIHNKKSITTMISEATQVLLAHDADNDQRLNLSEFEAFIEAFMRAAGGYTLAEVVDHLITLQHTKDDNACLQKALEASEDSIAQQLSGASASAAATAAAS